MSDERTLPLNKSASGETRKRSRGRPRREDVAAIDGQLLSVALGEFILHGYGGTSMARIAKSAKISKTTLYLRYASKEDLFRAIMHQQVDRIAPSALLTGETGPTNLEEGLKSYANRMLQLSLEGDMLAINRLIYSESCRFPELGTAASERTRLGVKRISDFIRERARRDDIPCRDPDTIAEVFIYMIRGWYVSIMLTNRNVSASQRSNWVQRSIDTLLASRQNW